MTVLVCNVSNITESVAAAYESTAFFNRRVDQHTKHFQTWSESAITSRIIVCEGSLLSKDWAGSRNDGVNIRS